MSEISIEELKFKFFTTLLVGFLLLLIDVVSGSKKAFKALEPVIYGIYGGAGIYLGQILSYYFPIEEVIKWLI